MVCWGGGGRDGLRRGGIDGSNQNQDRAIRGKG